ncbi:MAG: GHKL domain-containing protein [Rhodobacteraceae bacterium]|nr:GHKL domain-containing protein [Paracoccaceae bacterium]
MDWHFLDDILGGVNLPLVMIGADELIFAANPAAKAILETSQIGRHHAIALRQPALLAAIEVALRDRVAGQARYVIHGPSHEVAYLVTVTPVSGTDKSGVLCAFQDTTEQELIGQLRRDFVANVSHELRTPLTALAGFIETLKEAARDDPAARDRFLTIMQRETGRMSRLVQDLLSLSKVEAEERRRPTTAVNVVAVIQSAVAALHPVADAAGVVLEIYGADIAQPVPADADQLLQVFQNLIENAIKYGASGKLVRVDIHPPSNEMLLQIDVVDHGEGIEEQHLQRLTERFYRVDTHRSREKGGTGLGLAIVKHIVNRHRGHLTISSELGKGSCFTVLLPRN